MKLNRNVIVKKFVLPFKSGFFATLVFHQGLILLLYYLNFIDRQPYNMTPTQPFLVPSVLSLAFFGGLWGILIWSLIIKQTNQRKLLFSLVLGAFGPTLVAMLIVFPLKGLPVTASLFGMGLLLNAFWGFGLWLLMQFQPKV